MITAQRIRKAAGQRASLGWRRLQAALGARPTRHCPACKGDVVGFFRYGETAAWGCPTCGASPRARLMNYLIDSGALTLPPQAAILHMAPNEASLVERFRATSVDYVPADLFPDIYKVPGIARVDLMALSDTDRFDRIYASHVMEHVPDDAQVLSNLYRALKPGGEAWLLVPLHDAPTEDGTPDMSPKERERRFGQWDHVRQYGPDFADRIRAAGFTLTTARTQDFDAATVARLGLGEQVFIARKP